MTKTITERLIYTTLDKITIKNIDCENICSVNALLCWWKQGVTKKICRGLEWNLNGGKGNYYRKDWMKIKFNFDNDLLLDKPLKFHAMAIIIRTVFGDDGKLYPEVFLNDAL